MIDVLIDARAEADDGMAVLCFIAALLVIVAIGYAAGRR